MNKYEFIEAVRELGIEVNDYKLELLDRYYELLVEWNEKINLTAITTFEEVYLKHFYDSLTLTKVVDFSRQESFCDIGTGAGFPGIVIKIFFPQLKVTLVDALNKRINFLGIVARELGLSDVILVHARAEEYALSHREEFDVVTARAVASLNVLLEYSLPLVKVGKWFIALKGREEGNYSHALDELGGKVVCLEEFLLPKENSQRTIIKVEKVKTTTNKYPRRFSEIKKRPL